MDSIKPTILVIGGTGMLGRPVVERIAKDGHFAVKVFSRHLPTEGLSPSSDHPVEYVQGNIQDDESLSQAMEDCVGVHLNLSGGTMERIGAEQVAKLATRKKNLRWITMISGVTTNAEQAQKFDSTKAKWDAEQSITKVCQELQQRVSYTIFRCTIFLETLPKWKYLIGDQRTKWHWLAADDYARMVSHAYQDLMANAHTTVDASKQSSAANRIFYLHGPGPTRTLPEAIFDVYLPKFEEAIAQQQNSSGTSSVPSVQRLSWWWAQFLSWTGMSWTMTGMTSAKWSAFLTKMNWLSQIQEMGDPSEANATLGGPPTITMEDWIDNYLQEQDLQQNTTR